MIKKSAAMFVVLCLFLWQASALQENLNPEKIERLVFSSKTIELLDNEGNLVPQMKPGNMVVLQYSKQHAEDPNMSDDELHESVLFEVNPAWNSFVYRKKIALSKATYQLGCFCAERGYYRITGGFIRGKKLANGKYYIQADVSFTFKNGVTKKIKFSGEFKPAA